MMRQNKSYGVQRSGSSIPGWLDGSGGPRLDSDPELQAMLPLDSGVLAAAGSAGARA